MSLEPKNNTAHFGDLFEKGDGIVYAAYNEGTKPRFYDANNLFSYLFTSKELSGAISELPEVLDCIERFENGYTPTNKQIELAQKAEQEVLDKMSAPIRVGGIFGMFAKEIPGTPDPELETRAKAYEALASIYRYVNEDIYLEYCEAVDAAKSVCDTLQLDAKSFPPFVEFLQMPEEKRHLLVGQYEQALKLVDSRFDIVVGNKEIISETLTGDKQTDLHMEEFVDMFLDMNPAEAIEHEFQTSKIRVDFIEASVKHRGIFNQGVEFKENHIFGTTPANLALHTQDIEERSNLARDLHLALIRNNNSGLSPEQRKEAFAAHANSSTDTLRTALEHFTKADKDLSQTQR